VLLELKAKREVAETRDDGDARRMGMGTNGRHVRLLSLSLRFF